MSSFEIGATRPVGAVQMNTVQPASQGAAPASPAPVTSVTSGTAPVETSPGISAGTVPVDQSRVAEIRAAVQNGTYPMIPTKISDAMIAAGVLLQKAS